MKKHIVDKHQELLDEFAKAVLPSVHNYFIDGSTVSYKEVPEVTAKASYKIAQAMVNERSRLIKLRRECEYKQRLNIADCNECPERHSCNK